MVSTHYLATSKPGVLPAHPPLHSEPGNPVGDESQLTLVLGSERDGQDNSDLKWAHTGRDRLGTIPTYRKTMVSVHLNQVCPTVPLLPGSSVHTQEPQVGLFTWLPSTHLDPLSWGFAQSV